MSDLVPVEEEELVSTQMELELAARWDRVNDIVTLYLKGEPIPKIAKKLKLKIAEVQDFINEWKADIRHNQPIQVKARDSVHNADQHFTALIREFYDVVEDAKDTGNLSARNTALKSIAELEAKRVEMLQKTGLLDIEAMGEAVIENEKKMKILVDLLRGRVEECRSCGPIIERELSRLSQKYDTVQGEQV